MDKKWKKEAKKQQRILLALKNRIRCLKFVPIYEYGYLNQVIILSGARAEIIGLLGEIEKQVPECTRSVAI